MLSSLMLSSQTKDQITSAVFVIPGVQVSSVVIIDSVKPDQGPDHISCICYSRCTGIKCCYLFFQVYRYQVLLFVIPGVQVSSVIIIDFVKPDQGPDHISCICYSRCTGIKCCYLFFQVYRYQVLLFVIPGVKVSVLLFVIPGLQVSSAVIYYSRCTGIKCCYLLFQVYSHQVLLFVIPGVQVSSAIIIDAIKPNQGPDYISCNVKT